MGRFFESAQLSAPVGNVLAGDEAVVVLVLGGNHDLAVNMPGGAEIVRVDVAGIAVARECAVFSLW